MANVQPASSGTYIYLCLFSERVVLLEDMILPASSFHTPLSLPSPSPFLPPLLPSPFLPSTPLPPPPLISPSPSPFPSPLVHSYYHKILNLLLCVVVLVLCNRSRKSRLRLESRRAEPEHLSSSLAMMKVAPRESKIPEYS